MAVRSATAFWQPRGEIVVVGHQFPHPHGDRAEPVELGAEDVARCHRHGGVQRARS